MPSPTQPDARDILGIRKQDNRHGFITSSVKNAEAAIPEHAILRPPAAWFTQGDEQAHNYCVPVGTMDGASYLLLVSPCGSLAVWGMSVVRTMNREEQTRRPHKTQKKTKQKTVRTTAMNLRDVSCGSQNG